MTEENKMPEIIDFLLGEGTLNGLAFSERPSKTGAYWWKEHLLEYQFSVQSRLEAAEKMAQALEKVIEGFKGFDAPWADLTATCEALANWKRVTEKK